MSWHGGHPDDIAIVKSDAMLSYAELDTLVVEKIEVLRQSGIGAGHRIALYETSSIDYIITLIALIERGVVVCPMNTRWPETAVSEAIGRINAVLLQDVLARGHNTQSIEASHILTDHRWATVVFTSGSSGAPKAVVHSLANHRASAQLSNQNIRLERGDRWLLSLPLYHVGGLGVLFRCLEVGATIVLPDGQSLDAAIMDLKPTHISLVSTQLYRLLRDKVLTNRLSHMKTILMGGSAISSHLIRNAVDEKIPLFTSYGMTEMSTQITCTQMGATIEELSTSGKPLIDTSIRLSLAGEIQVSGPCLFQGYLTGDALELPLDNEGYFSTGDTGYFDAHGHLYVVGRNDRMFNSGGENIQPATIERALTAQDGVVQAIVFPVADEEFGHRPVAFVRMDESIDVESLKSRLRNDLPGFMVPKRILSWSEALDEGVKPTVEMLQRLWDEYNSSY